jgi:hypothetical protein
MTRNGRRVIGSQIDLFVFDATPQPLNQHVVPPGPFSIHADGDAVAGKQTGVPLFEVPSKIGVNGAARVNTLRFRFSARQLLGSPPSYSRNEADHH